MQAAECPVNGETLAAMVNSMGGLAMVLARQLNTEQRAAMAADLLKLANNSQAQGKTLEARLFMDMHRATV